LNLKLEIDLPTDSDSRETSLGYPLQTCSPRLEESACHLPFAKPCLLGSTRVLALQACFAPRARHGTILYYAQTGRHPHFATYCAVFADSLFRGHVAESSPTRATKNYVTILSSQKQYPNTQHRHCCHLCAHDLPTEMVHHSDRMHWEIISVWESSHSIQGTANTLHTTRKAVRHAIHALNAAGSIVKRKSAGRPRALSGTAQQAAAMLLSGEYSSADQVAHKLHSKGLTAKVVHKTTLIRAATSSAKASRSMLPGGILGSNYPRPTKMHGWHFARSTSAGIGSVSCLLIGRSSYSSTRGPRSGKCGGC
jgi:L-lactate utilization protein LutC